MAKFNVVQKARRERSHEKKRAVHGDPASGKLTQRRGPPVSLSGKRKRKLLKKWRRDQKQALEKGLVTMEDVEMAIADEGSSQGTSEKPHMKVHLKKKSRLQIKRLRGKGKKKGKSTNQPANEKIDAMVE
uniref:Pm52 protein n=1 Tax=Ananas comosus var. bracteatus TaxID=296719 RepID=A0A6V7QDH4_ANACO|nr:unnamed protein product [Ananas comosus var. bracteatus]